MAQDKAGDVDASLSHCYFSSYVGATGWKIFGMNNTRGGYSDRQPSMPNVLVGTGSNPPSKNDSHNHNQPWEITNSITPSPVRYVRPCLGSRVGGRFTTAVLLLSLIPSVQAIGDGDSFANNLFSDLAPILALFGEQVAKQFLSESTGWADNILFAMGPLGIITGIVSAVRVAGGPFLKAIVGRGKEGQAQVELELMSSNSPDVGEMWNGQAIVRVLGAPSIFELVYAPDQVVSDPAGSIAVLNQDNPFFERVQRT